MKKARPTTCPRCCEESASTDLVYDGYNPPEWSPDHRPEGLCEDCQFDAWIEGEINRQDG